ncbi:MAG: endonuclease [Tenericutes bacterium]|nr:endonuclease [Mycoplasmatota bacterium]
MKRAFKIILIIITLVIFLGAGFILTLHLTEFKPPESKIIEVSDNSDNSSDNYFDLDTTIKLLTFNTGYASLSETEDFVMDGGEKGRMDTKEEVEANIDGISSILERENVDIYLLQEVDVDSSRSYNIDQYDHYKTILGSASVLAYNYRCVFVPFPLDITQMMGKVNSGIATFSDNYTSEAERIQLPGSFSWPLRLANLKRCILISRFPINGTDKELIVINVHLSAYDDGSMRQEETAALQAIMQIEYDLGNYVVVGGDFNQTFPDAVDITYNSGTDTYTYDYLYELIDENYWQAPPIDDDWFLVNNFQFGIDISVPTCRLLNQPLDKVNSANNQYYVIDGFIVSPNVTISSAETLDENFVYSDHNPVKLEITLNS